MTFSTRSIAIILALLVSACGPHNPPTHSLEVAIQGLHSGALSDDGEFAVVGSIVHGGSLWRLRDEERLYNWNHDQQEPTTITSADISGDGRWALTASVNTMVLWDIESGAALRYWTAPGEILDVKLDAAASIAALGLSNHTAVIFDIRRGGILHTFTHQNRVRSVDFSANGRVLLTGSEDYHAVAWNAQTGAELQRVKHQDDVQLVKLSGDGRLALSVSKYDRALLWDTVSGETLGEVPLQAERLKRGLRFTAARFSADNQFLLTGRPDQWVQLWQLNPLLLIDSWELPKRDKWKPTGAAVLDLAFKSVDQAETGDFVAIASNGFIHRLQRNPPNNGGFF